MRVKSTINKGFLIALLMLTMMFAFATTANAVVYDSTAKGTHWILNTDTGVLTIDVDGPMGSWTQGSQPWYKYRSYIKSIEFESATSKITNYAFSDLVALEVIEIPNSVEEIGDRAFLNCSGATELYIPISIGTWGGNVFEGCKSIEYIYTENQANISMSAPIWDASVGSTAEGGVELQIESRAIGQYAFYGLSSVTTVKLPTTLTAINDYAFYGFTSPFTLNLGSATKIGKYAFFQATGVTSISLPVATTIGEHAFDGCTAATKINIPVATSIGDYAFANCSSAKEIIVGASGTITFGAYAFQKCKAVTDLYLGNITFTSGKNSLSELGKTNGVTVTLGKNITAISGTLQSGYIGTTGAMTLQLEEGSALSSVAANAFKDNTMLVEVDFSNRAGAITYGTEAFNNCSNLLVFTSNTGAATLNNKSLANLKKLTNLNWNASTTNLGWSAPSIEVTRTLSASTLTGSTTNGSTSISMNGSYNTGNFTFSATSGSATEVSVDVGNAYNPGWGYYTKYITAIYYQPTLTPSKTSYTNSSQVNLSSPVTNTISASGTSTLTYSFSGENTGNHPFFNLGSSTTSGTSVLFGVTVSSIPDYMLTSGIQMVETSNGTQTVSPATQTVSNTPAVNASGTASLKANSSSTYSSGIYDAGGYRRYFSEYYFNTSGGWAWQNLGGSEYVKTKEKNYNLSFTGKIGVTHLSTVNNTLSYAVSKGTKQTYNTGIKVSSINSISKNLTTVGRNVEGSINYDLATTTNKVTIPTVNSATNSTSLTGTTTISPTASSVTPSGFSTTYVNAGGAGNYLFNATYYTNGNGGPNGYNWIVISHDQSNATTTGSTSYQGQFYTSPGATSRNYGTYTTNSSWFANSNTGYGGVSRNWYSTGSSYTWNYYGYYGHPSQDAAEAMIRWFTGNAPTLRSAMTSSNVSSTISYSSGTMSGSSTSATVSTAQSTKNETLTVSSISKNAYDNGNNQNDGAILINLSSAAQNASISQYAFTGNRSVVNVYLASAFGSINTNAFYTKATGGQMYIYGHTNSDAISLQDGIKTNNSYTIHWEPNLRDYGMFVAVYDIGTTAKAYLYNTSGDNYLINISGSGATNNFTAVGRPEWAALYGDKVTTVIVDDTITSLGEYIFYGHSALEDVTLGSGVTTLGAHSFDGASSLETVPEGAGVTTLGSQAFANTAIKTASIQSTITTLGESVFYHSPVSTIRYAATSANPVTAATKPFADITKGDELTLTIENNVTSIPAYMFYGCDATTVNIGSGVETIGEGAFSGMPYASINVASDNVNFRRSPSGNGDLYKADGQTLVTYLASHADANYALPETTTAVAAGAFYGNPNITQVSFGAAITSVGDNAFAACPKLKVISVSDFMDEDSFEAEVQIGDNWSGDAQVIYSGLDWDIGVTPGKMSARLYSDGSLIIAGSGAMKNWASANSVEWAAKRGTITSVSFIGDITTIGAYAFYGAEHLGDVSLPKSLTTIGQYAFYGCTVLNGVSIPNGVSTIETYTFGNCSKLGFVDVGTGVTTIEPFAFAGCTNGQYVSIGGNVKVIKANAFKGCNYLTVLMVGKSAKTDFDEATGVPTPSTSGTSDLFRICWLYDIDNGYVLHRYPGNTGAASKVESLRTSMATQSDLWGYGYDTDGDGEIDYLHFVGNSSMANFENPEDAYWHNIRETLTSVRMDTDVTSVGKNAFVNCPNLRFARIGQQCNTIGDFAFKNCPSLAEFFCDATNLVSMPTQASEIFVGSGSEEGFTAVFEDHVQSIPQNLFYGCANLSNLTLGESVRSIGVGAFANTDYLKSVFIKSKEIATSTENTFTNAGRLSGGFAVELAASVTVVPSSLFKATAGSPYVTSVTADAGSKLKTIYGSAFYGCSRLASVYFANCTLLQQVQENAFANCTRLIEANFSNCTSLRSFGASAFEECIGLADFDISNCEGLESFGTKSHYKCAAIRELVLPRSVNQVNSQCFDGWTNEQTIYVLGKASSAEFTGGAGANWAGNGTNADVVVLYSTLSWDVTDTTAINPETGEAYPARTVMAYYCPNRNNFTNQSPHLFISGTGPIKDFANNDAQWTNNATNYATQVTHIIIGDSVTRIGDYAFAGMSAARSLTMGRNVAEVGKYAFYGDESIPEVDFTVAAANIKTIGESAFEDCSGVSTVNLSGCDALEAINANAFKNLSGSSNVYVSSDYWYDYLTFNSSGKIDSTYGTTNNTHVIMVRVYFTQNLASQGVMQGQPVTWHVETRSQTGGTTFKWYFAEAPLKDAQGNIVSQPEWTEVTSSMPGYRIVSTETGSDLYMDASIVTLDKSGYYFYCDAISPYYNAKSNIATMAVYSAAITPTVNVYDKNGNPLESNTWTQGPLAISITAGDEAEAQGASYQYKLKASGSWKNTESKMSYDTEGIVTMYVRAIINGDSNTASPAIKFILKVDNSAPSVTNITADPEVGATDSVTLTATATDNISGVNSINWYKAAEDTSGSGVKGYVPIIENKDMYYMVIEVKEFVDDDGDGTYNQNFYRTRYDGQNASILETETYSKTGASAEVVDDAGTLANIEAAKNIIKTPSNTAGTISRFKLYEVHVGDLQDDYEISASDKGVVIIPIPDGYVTRNASGKVTENRVAVYTFNSNGVLTPITRYNLTSNGTGIVIPISRFGQYLIAEKAPEELP